MRERIYLTLTAVLLLAGWGCAAAVPQPEAAHPADLVVTMLERHLGQLNANVDRLDKQLADLQKVPETPDPTLREIRALDLSGWQVHQQQLKVQREHFRFALEQLRQVQAHPDDKARLLEQWTRHEQEYERALDDLRQQRHQLEQQRHKVEAQVVERYLR
jgi:chromosome segregation ATPase